MVKRAGAEWTKQHHRKRMRSSDL